MDETLCLIIVASIANSVAYFCQRDNDSFVLISSDSHPIITGKLLRMALQPYETAHATRRSCHSA